MGSTKVDLSRNVNTVDTPANGDLMIYNGNEWVAIENEKTAVFTVAGDLAVGDRGIRFYYPYSSGSMQVSRVRAAVNVAPTGSTLLVQLRRWSSSGSVPVGTTTVSASAYTGSNSGSLSNIYLAPGYWWTISLLQVGSTVEGTDLAVEVIGTIR
jgi:hypothetical protein